MSEIDLKPEGTLSLQTIAMPADTNWSGDVFGGWIVSQMDLAGAIHAERFSKGRCATIAINQMAFLVPVKVGDVISCYTKILKVGNTSIQMQIEVWDSHDDSRLAKRVTAGVFTFVAVDREGNKRQIPEELKHM
ncbi:acyl-CoA thioesterase [Acinetobacter sp. MD2]|uniref:acyl-CoA thioesterase n=1 Tax=Acinetobacter sp. MD2 TaxID=2600066 RepID=UPI002D1ED382|nr:acyl-CoA thioesterase [Acinetobacter sp. MD2]MEB3768242.1 acyl-CoA thioesterase [Acinetobacter sp. MD2]